MDLLGKPSYSGGPMRILLPQTAIITVAPMSILVISSSANFHLSISFFIITCLMKC